MGRILEGILIALRAIWSSKLRSFMSVLGNIVAVTSIITVVSLIQGLNATVTDAIVSEVGADTFVVDRYGVTRSEEDFDKVRSNPQITLRDASAIKKYSPLVQSVMAESSRAGQVAFRDDLLESVSVRGVSAEYVNFSSYEAERGRLLSPSEVERNRNVVLLGWGTADRLFGQGDPLDKIIKIEGVHFRVIGVNEKKGSIFGQSQDEFAVIPLGTFQKLFGARASLQLNVRPVHPDLVEEAMQDATVALRIERRLKPKQKDNFGMLTSDSLLAIYHQATNGIFAVLVGVVALSLLVGGIVIMNIMLMVVTERTFEIGLRKALGAKRRDIMLQVLAESVTLSVAGGIVGTSLGFLLAWVISSLSPLPASVQPWSVALGIGITAVVGVVFGVYPAMRAARLDPIEALRRD
ncbi:MAG TPA: ABC transporter permease [Vicinamibacterales bacterium]|nr:ABC transporter permease [Vicinamibacterales bacterium]